MLLDENTGVVVVMLRSIRLHFAGVWISATFYFIFVHSVTTCAKFDLRFTFRNVMKFA